jgi:hypothetical protein
MALLIQRSFAECGQMELLVIAVAVVAYFLGKEIPLTGGKSEESAPREELRHH